MSDKYREIDEESLRALMTAFYAKAREDDMIGPIFLEKIGTTEEDWAPHMDRVVAFWSSVLLKTKGYPGGLVMKHNKIAGMNRDHFMRWMEIFMPTVNEVFDISPSLSITIKAQALMRALHQNYDGFQARKGLKTNEIPIA